MPAFVLESGASAIVHPGPFGFLTFDGDGGVVDFGAGRRVAGRLRFGLTGASSPSAFLPQPRMLGGFDGLTFPSIQILYTVPVGGMGPQTLDLLWTNAVPTELDASGLAQFAKFAVSMFEPGASFHSVVTLFEGTEFTVETGAGVTGANVYANVAEVLARLLVLRPTTATCFAALAAERQEAVWVDATRRIEHQVERCPDGSPVSDDPDIQTLLFPRTDAHDSRGRDLAGLPTLAYIDGLILFAEEVACAEAAAQPVKDPSLMTGAKRVDISPEQADFTAEWSEPGHSGNFFTGSGRREVWDLLSTAWPARRRG